MERFKILSYIYVLFLALEATTGAPLGLGKTAASMLLLSRPLIYQSPMQPSSHLTALHKIHSIPVIPSTNGNGGFVPKSKIQHRPHRLRGTGKTLPQPTSIPPHLQEFVDVTVPTARDLPALFQSWAKGEAKNLFFDTLAWKHINGPSLSIPSPTPLVEKSARSTLGWAKGQVNNRIVDAAHTYTLWPDQWIKTTPLNGKAGKSASTLRSDAQPDAQTSPSTVHTMIPPSESANWFTYAYGRLSQKGKDWVRRQGLKQFGFNQSLNLLVNKFAAKLRARFPGKFTQRKAIAFVTRTFGFKGRTLR